MFENTIKLKQKLKNRDLLFGGWVSFAEPCITDTISKIPIDFMAIDMEHSTINLSECQRIISTSQGNGVPCLPRPVSHSNNYIKPIIEFGADGLIMPMVNNKTDLDNIINNFMYPPIGHRSYGVNRAQHYGLNLKEYINNWNDHSILIVQIESVEAIANLDEILKSKYIDGVMIGPYDIAGSLGVPGDVKHNKVIEASKYVINKCKNAGISCGTQVEEITIENVERLFKIGHNFSIMGSDLFVIANWAKDTNDIIKHYKG